MSTTSISKTPNPALNAPTPFSESWLAEENGADPRWQALLRAFWASGPGLRLRQFIQARLQSGAVVYPPNPLRALRLTPLHAVRVVILGQDPYHGPGQAEGLAFSVSPGQRIPPSLRNIFKECIRDAGAYSLAAANPAQEGPSALHKALHKAFPNGSLLPWAQQGVLLWNSVLTVEKGRPASHAKQGWEALTQAVIHALLQAAVERNQALVFLLWGASAQAVWQEAALGFNQKTLGRDGERHGHTAAKRHLNAHVLVLQANHPSPLAAARGSRPFIGCGHFSQANAFLQAQGRGEVDWLIH